MGSGAAATNRSYPSSGRWQAHVRILASNYQGWHDLLTWKVIRSQQLLSNRSVRILPSMSNKSIVVKPREICSTSITLKLLIKSFCKWFVIHCHYPTCRWKWWEHCTAVSSLLRIVSSTYPSCLTYNRLSPVRDPMHYWWFITRMRQLCRASMIFRGTLDFDTTRQIIWKFTLNLLLL